MQNVIAVLRGKKTYIALVLGALVVLANKFLGVEIPGVALDPNDWMTNIWALVLGATGRAAVSKVS